MKRQICICIVSILFAFASNLSAQQQTPFVKSVSNVGTSAATFLNIGVGARAIAMGAAFTAVANDASALYWNPAGISLCRHPEITFNHLDWLLDIYHDFVGVVIPAGRHSFGASLTYLGMPDQKVRTVARPEGTGNFYSASDLSLAVSYAFQFTDQFAMGMTAKYIHQQIYNTSASAYAVDFGVHYRPSSIKWMQLGMQIANFGTDLKLSGRALAQKIDIDPKHNSNDRLPASLDTDAFSLPLVFRFGLAATTFHSKQHHLVTAMDLIHPSDNTESVNLGLEYTFHGFAVLRAGYSSLGERDYRETGGLTLGAGLKIYVAGVLMILDYAYRDFGILNNVSRVSCGLRF